MITFGSLALRFGPYIIAGGLASFGVWQAYSWAWDRGYDAHAAEVAQATDELNEQLEEAKERERRLAADLLRAADEAGQLKALLAEEAEGDEAAGRPSMSVSGSMRLNRAR